MADDTKAKCPCCGEPMTWSGEPPKLYDWCGFCSDTLKRLGAHNDTFRYNIVIRGAFATLDQVRTMSLDKRKRALSCNHAPDEVFFKPCPNCGRSTDWSGG